jgi:hypothetical protein
VLGLVVFINCKSGLDRTGLQVGMQTCQSALWNLYPQLRWGLHLTAINWHLLQSRYSDGKDEYFNQPLSSDGFASEQVPSSYIQNRFLAHTYILRISLEWLQCIGSEGMSCSPGFCAQLLTAGMLAHRS